MTGNSTPVLIVGGGIGGLTLALSLATLGRRSHILEARPVFSEAGAGIQLGPNATRVLSQIGVADLLAESVSRPAAIKVRDARTARSISELPLGDWIEERHNAPYWVAHRVDLQAALVAKATASPLIKISMNYKITELDNGKDADKVTAISENGQSVSGDILVGSDGLWSTVRKYLYPDYNLPYSGTTAARAILQKNDIPPDFLENVTSCWLAPNAHVVHYPVRAGQALAIIVVTSAPQPSEGWGAAVPSEEIMAATADFNKELRDLLARAKNWHRWALFTPAPLKKWSRGRVTLLGDAAHPILPFLAQGGAMAIEDAIVLAWELTKYHDSHDIAFYAYEAQRRNRVRHIQKTSRDNGKAYHLKGVSASARNIVLSALSPARMMQRYDWVYGWQHNRDIGEIKL